MSERVLVIAAHPDDEVLGCGGVMARHVAAGDTVGVLIATRGAPDVFSQEHITTVQNEIHAAHAVLGVSFFEQMEFLAPKLDSVPGYQLASAVGKVIQSYQAATLYVPHRGDIHGDHQALYRAALVAARPINDCSVRRILSYETLSETEWAPPTGDMAFVPTVFVDISRHLDQKLRAMACYASQLKPEPNARSLRAIEALAQVRGATVSLDAAEAFVLVRESQR